MATRSTIAIERQDGTIAMVYCHWDGYLKNNGRILYQHYSDPAKLERLIEHGDISSLGEDIGEKHDFDMRTEGWTTFYRRDRGERFTNKVTFENFDDYLDNHQYEEFDYILKNNGQWIVCAPCCAPNYEPLADLLP